MSIYDWKRCTHEGIGQPGCPTCDPDHDRVMIRAQRLDNAALRAERDDERRMKNTAMVVAEAEHAKVARLREVLEAMQTALRLAMNGLP